MTRIDLTDARVGALKPCKTARGVRDGRLNPEALDMDEIWQRILDHAGERFHILTGLPFTYEVMRTD